MKSLVQHPIAKIALPVLVILAALLIAKLLIAAKPELVAEPKPKSAPLVRVIDVQLGTVNFEIVSQGEVRAKNSIVISADVSGRVIAVNEVFLPGLEVAAGDWLVKIDPANYELALREAELALADAQLNLADEHARLGVKVGSSRADKVNDNPRIVRAKAQIQAALARVKKAKTDLSRSTVIAPATGLVASKNVAFGQYTNVASKVGELLATDVAEIRLPVDIKDLASVQGALPLPVKLVRSDGASWTATIVRVEQQLDRATRLAYLVAELEMPYEQSPVLRFGDFVDARITGLSAENAVVVPRAALLPGNRIYVVEPNATLREMVVDVVRTWDSSAVLRGAFKSTDRVVLDRLALMADGMEVRAVNETPKNSADKSAPQ